MSKKIDLSQHINFETYFREHVQKARKRGDQIDGLCPLHDDTTESFTCNTKTGLCHCRSGCGSGDIVWLHGEIHGLDRKNAFKDLCVRYNIGNVRGKPVPKPRGRRIDNSSQGGLGGGPDLPGPGLEGGSAGGGAETPEEDPPPLFEGNPEEGQFDNPPPHDSSHPDRAKKLVRGDDGVSIMEKKVLAETTLDKYQPLPEWFPKFATTRGWSEEVIREHQVGYDADAQRITLPIRDEVGDIVNIRKYKPKAKENKVISYGKGFGTGRLYPISVLMDKGRRDEPVILCEGEPDVLCALSQGLCAVTTTTGAATWNDSYNANFKGRRVIIAYDNDRAGKEGAERVALRMPLMAQSVEIIQWPEFMASREDLTDWFITHGKTAEDLLNLPRSRIEDRDPGSASLNDDPYSHPDVLAINEHHALVLSDGGTLILRETINDKGELKVTFLSKHDFSLWLNNKTILVPNAKGNLVEKCVAELWLKSPHRRDYEGIVFSPEQNVNGQYNLYRGRVTQPRPGVWDKYRAHIYDVICSQNPEVYEYVLNWIAHLFQSPGGGRPGVALVLKGGQGAGKGVFVSQLGKILGHHYMQISNSAHITGRFNNHLKDALLVFLDEGVWGGDRTAEGTLKALITEDTILVEPKGREAFTVENHCRLIVASNNSWIVPAGLGERRMCVIEVSDRHCGIRGSSYFVELLDEMDHGGREAFLHDMLARDISHVDLRDFPRTDQLLEQGLRSMSSTQAYWYNCLMYGEHVCSDQSQWTYAVSRQQLYSRYLEFCKLGNIRYPAMDSIFFRDLRKICPTPLSSRQTMDGKRQMCMAFKPLEQCREYFAAKSGFVVDWQREIGEPVAGPWFPQDDEDMDPSQP